MINSFAVGLLATLPTRANAGAQRVVPAKTIRENSAVHSRINALLATQIPPAIAANLQKRVNLAVTLSRGRSAESFDVSLGISASVGMVVRTAT
jgi:hypothetical protein